VDEAYQHELRRLGLAINDAVTSSAEVNAALDHIRALGIDVFLVLEATICIRRRSERDAAGGADVEEEPTPLEISAEDRQFLRRLRISVDVGDEGEG
jgi:hypothetical protein